MSPARDRLDRELAGRGLARSRSHARQLIDSGVVQVNGTACHRSSELIAGRDQLRVTVADPYVSRAAHKLVGALDDLALSVDGRALDAGSSTGGFTQVLLERGCDPVYAVDVGREQLDYRLKADPRVRSFERFNLVDLDLDVLDDQPVDLVVADVSFISLRKLLHRLSAVLQPEGRLLAMVKPQFEAGPHQVTRGGAVASPLLRRTVVADVIDAAADLGLRATGIAPSRVLGPAGNREFFVQFRPERAGRAHDTDVSEGLASQVDTIDLDAVEWGS